MKDRLYSFYLRKKNAAIMLLIDFLIVFASYALLAIKHVSADGYYHVFANDLWAPMTAGRVVWGMLLRLLTVANINVFHEQGVCIVVFIAALSWCAWRILCNVKQEFSLQEGVIYSIPILLGFINVFLQEWFIFAESALFYAIGIVTALESAIAVAKRKYICSFILLMISVLCYQIMLSLFVVYALFIVYNKEQGQTIRSYIPTVILGGIAGVVSILAQKIAKMALGISVVREVDFSINSILSKIPTILEKLWSTLLDAQGILPPVITPILIVLSFLSISVFYMRNKSKHAVFGIMVLFLLILTSLGVIIIPIILSSDIVWMPPRVLVGIFALISMMALSAVLRLTGGGRVMMITLTLGLLVINIFTSQAITVDMFKNNVLDQHLDHQAQAYIEQYEQESGNAIEQIAFYYDESYGWHYPEVGHVWYDTNLRTILIEGQRLNRINYHCSEYYLPAEASDAVFEQFFAGKNWDTFMPDQQFVMIDNTLHWCVY